MLYCWIGLGVGTRIGKANDDLNASANVVGIENGLKFLHVSRLVLWLRRRRHCRPACALRSTAIKGEGHNKVAAAGAAGATSRALSEGVKAAMSVSANSAMEFAAFMDLRNS